MKILELSENMPLKVIEISRTIEVPEFVIGPDVTYSKLIFMKILTDGVIDKESEEKIEKISEYYIGKRKYDSEIDTKKNKYIYFKNYNFVISYLISKRFSKYENIYGWFDTIEKIDIYLKNKKDKEALKNAKNVIKDIQSRKYNIDYSSLCNMIFSKREEVKNYEIINSNENVYELKLK